MLKLMKAFLSTSFFCLLFACESATLASTANAPSAIEEVSATRCTELLSSGGVFIFFEPSCPICAEYFPTIERLNSKYGSSVQFYLVLKAGDDTPLKSFANDYHPHSTILNDKSSRLQKALGARVTPQAFLVRAGKTIYSGRIDDRYYSIGNRRGIIRSNDLELALDSPAGTSAPATKTTEPVGCFLEAAEPIPQEQVKHASK